MSPSFRVNLGKDVSTRRLMRMSVNSVKETANLGNQRMQTASEKHRIRQEEEMTQIEDVAGCSGRRGKGKEEKNEERISSKREQENRK